MIGVKSTSGRDEHVENCAASHAGWMSQFPSRTRQPERAIGDGRVKKVTERVLKMFTALKERDWSALRQFQTFDGVEDDVEVYAIRGSEHLTLVAIKTHLELFQPVELLYREVLDQKDALSLGHEIAEAEWHPFSTHASAAHDSLTEFHFEFHFPEKTRKPRRMDESSRKSSSPLIGRIGKS